MIYIYLFFITQFMCAQPNRGSLSDNLRISNDALISNCLIDKHGIKSLQSQLSNLTEVSLLLSGKKIDQLVKEPSANGSSKNTLLQIMKDSVINNFLPKLKRMIPQGQLVTFGGPSVFSIQISQENGKDLIILKDALFACKEAVLAYEKDKSLNLLEHAFIKYIGMLCELTMSGHDGALARIRFMDTKAPLPAIEYYAKQLKKQLGLI